MTSSDTTSRHPGGTADLAGRPVARIGYGVMQLALTGHRGPVDPATAVTVLRTARELGVNHLDTAQFYGDGDANRLIREALHPYADDLVLVSKVGAVRRAGTATGLATAQKPAELRAQVEENLATLDVERLDVVNVRRTDQGAGLTAEGDQVVDLDDQLAEMVALRDEGKIGAIGLSNISLEQLRQALPVGIACVQNAYSLVARDDEPLLDLCREHGIAWVPFFPLGGAFPGMPKVTDLPAVGTAAETIGASPAQIGLAWLLAHAPDVLLIPGTSSVEHLRDNLATADVQLDEETMAALDAA